MNKNYGQFLLFNPIKTQISEFENNLGKWDNAVYNII